MCLRSNPPASPDVNSVLKTIQERTRVYKQVLTTLAPFLTTNDPLYPEVHGNTYSLVHHGRIDSRVDLSRLDLIILHDENPDISELAKATRIDIEISLTHFDILLHPMRSLPNDILLLIFQWYTTAYEYLPDHHGSLDSRYPSWTVTHVCRRWRHLALALPSLWSTVHLSQSMIREDVLLSRLDLQLQRSRSVPLAVTFDESCSDLLAGRDRMTSLLRSTTDRWWSLSLCMILPEDGYDDDAVFEGCSFDNLTHLTVMEMTDTGEHDIPVFTFRYAPRLTQVYLLGEYRIDLIWDSVEVYKTCLFSLALNSQLPSLRELTVDKIVPDFFGHSVGSEVFDDVPPIQLPRLVTLVLLSDNVYIFNHLSMPCLETLHLRLPSYECRDYPDLRPCSQHLQNLCLVSGYLGGYDLDMEHLYLLISFLMGASQVTALYLHDTNLLRTSMFRMDDGGYGLFPYLESLRVPVSIFWDTEVDVGEIEAIIESRLRAPTPRIRELRLIGSFANHSYMYDLTSWHAIVARLRSSGVVVMHTDTNDFCAYCYE